MDPRIAAAFGEDELLEASLDDWLGAAVPVAPAEPHFGPDGDHESTEPERVLPAADEDQADRIMGRVRRIDAEAARIHGVAERRIAEIRAWEADLSAGLATERAQAGQSIELFMRQWHRANPKRKSVTLVNGTPSLRDPGKGRVEVTDETAFKRWAHQHPEAGEVVRWQPEPNASALREVPTRHTRPDDTITDPRTNDQALYHTWGILVEVLANPEAEDGETVQAEVPGIRFVQRTEDKFSFKTADELAKPNPSEEEQP